MQTHAHVIKFAISEEAKVRNFLINLYSKCRLFGYARKLIDQSPELDLVSWSALISGYVQNGLAQEALLAFHEMHLLGAKCNHFTFPSVLKACTIKKDLRLGMQVHGVVIVTGFEDDEFVANSLVGLYAKCGDFRDSRRLFDEIPERSVVSWNALFACYVQKDFFGEAVDLFQEMIKSGISPNEFSLSSMINACTGLEDGNRGREIHGYLIKLGYDSDQFSANALVDMYAKLGNLDESIIVFEEISQPDIVSWNAIIAGCVLNENHEGALKFFRKMNVSETCPNMFTLSSVLKACAGTRFAELGRQLHSTLIKTDFKKLDLFVGVGLIDMYSKGILMDNARKVFDSMPEKDLIAWNALISGHSLNEEDIEAVRLLPSMHKFGVGFNQTTLSTVLKSIAKLQAIDSCKQIHVLSLKSGFEYDNYVLNSLIDAYGKCGYVQEATRKFEDCPTVDFVAFTSMITTYSQYGQGEEALKLYLEMLNGRIKPDSFVCSSLANACASLSAYEQGKQVHVHIYKLGFISDAFAGNSLVNMYAKCGCIDDASRAFSEINQRGIVSWSAMIGGFAQHGHGQKALHLFSQMLNDGVRPNHITLNIDIGRQAAEKLLALEPEKSGTHVLLANIYASAGMWNNAAETRRLMKNSDIKKEPGMSWIEVKDKVHTFIVGDRSHSRSSEIYAKLDELKDLLHKAGYVPMVETDLHDVEQHEKEKLLFHHSEKLAVAFGLLVIPPGAPIRVKKNLRICIDCHTVFKFVSKIVSREIIVRDINRYHHFRDGLCSCGDYW
ncbi:hypothetical protein ACFE04_001160 [Oxalis oulophora]